MRAQAANNSFNQAYQQGEAIGSVIGSLTNAWMAHRRQVKAEEKALKQEVLAYFDADIEALMAGVDLRTVQELMGHKSIQMTVRFRTSRLSTLWPLLKCWRGVLR